MTGIALGPILILLMAIFVIFAIAMLVSRRRQSKKKSIVAPLILTVFALMVLSSLLIPAVTRFEAVPSPVVVVSDSDVEVSAPNVFASVNDETVVTETQYGNTRVEVTKSKDGKKLSKRETTLYGTGGTRIATWVEKFTAFGVIAVILVLMRVAVDGRREGGYSLSWRIGAGIWVVVLGVAVWSMRPFV